MPTRSTHRVVLVFAVTLFPIAACKKSGPVPACKELASSIVAALRVETKNNSSTTEDAQLHIYAACEREPWKMDARRCLGDAMSIATMRECGDPGKQAVTIFEDLAKVKGVSGAPVYNSETGTWWVDGKDTGKTH